MQFLIAVMVMTWSFLSAVAPHGVSLLGDGASSSKKKCKIATPVIIQYGHPRVGVHHSPRLKHPCQRCDLFPVAIEPRLYSVAIDMNCKSQMHSLDLLKETQDTAFPVRSLPINPAVACEGQDDIFSLLMTNVMICHLMKNP